MELLYLFILLFGAGGLVSLGGGESDETGSGTDPEQPIEPPVTVPQIPPSTPFIGIEGTAASDALEGTAGSEAMRGLASGDTLAALEGDDTLFGGDGDDSLFGGPGTDQFFGGTGDDYIEDLLGSGTVDAGDGNDYLLLGDGGYSVTGGAGSDSINLEYATQKNTVEGGSGNDQITGSVSRDFIYGGEGNDYIWLASKGNDLAYGGVGDDVILLANGFYDVKGDAGDDRISFANTSKGQIEGNGGNDLFQGSGSDLTLLGGAGDDRFELKDSNRSAGQTTIFGGDGTDVLDLKELVWSGGLSQEVAIAIIQSGGSDGSFTLNSGHVITYESIEDFDAQILLRDDTLDGTPGDDVIDKSYVDPNDGDFLYLGDNTIVAGAGNDLVDVNVDPGLTGTYANQLVFGGEGDDSLSVLSATATLFGGDGNDEIFANAESGLSISGGNGDDTVYADSAIPTVSGGAGADIISFLSQDFGGIINGDAGDDIIETYGTLPAREVEVFGGTGNDQISGAFDEAIVFGGGDNDTITARGESSLSTLDGGDGDDIISGEGTGNWMTLYGGAGEDILIDSFFRPVGSSTAITLFGEQGNDTLQGTSGSVLFGGGGNDTFTLTQFTNQRMSISIDGGEGVDTLDVKRLIELGDIDETSLIINSDNSSGSFVLYDGTRVTFTSIEDLGAPVSAAPRDGIVTGTSGDDIIAVGYSEGFGADVVIAGDNTVDSGNGDDEISLFVESYGTTGQVTSTQTVLSGNGADEIIIYADASSVNAGTGNDSISVGGALSTDVVGGDGDDVIKIYADTMSISGGEGADAITYSNVENNPRFGFSVQSEVSGGAGNDVFDSDGDKPINFALFGGAGKDQFLGAVEDASIFGGEDNDSFTDTSKTGFTNDGFDTTTIYGGSGADDFSVSVRGYASEFHGDSGGDIFTSLSNQKNTFFGGEGADSLTIEVGATIFGGADNDTIMLTKFNGVKAATSIDGGAGIDSLNIQAFIDSRELDPDAITINPDGTSGEFVLADRSRVTFSSIEDFGGYIPDLGDGTLNGTEGDDVMTQGFVDAPYGDSFDANPLTIDAGAGNDSIEIAGFRDDLILNAFLGDGDDELNVYVGTNVSVSGQLGDDYIYVDAREAHLYGGEGNDALYANNPDATLFGGTGDDAIRYDLDSQGTAYGGEGHDSIFAEGKGGVAFGEAGNDIMTGTDGNELFGGAGDDVFIPKATIGSAYGLQNGVSINGGEGNDTLNIQNLIDSSLVDPSTIIIGPDGTSGSFLFINNVEVHFTDIEDFGGYTSTPIVI